MYASTPIAKYAHRPPTDRMRRGAFLVSLTASSPRTGSCVQLPTAAASSPCLGLDPASHMSRYVSRVHVGGYVSSRVHAGGTCLEGIF